MHIFARSRKNVTFDPVIQWIRYNHRERHIRVSVSLSCTWYFMLYFVYACTAVFVHHTSLSIHSPFSTTRIPIRQLFQFPERTAPTFVRAYICLPYTLQKVLTTRDDKKPCKCVVFYCSSVSTCLNRNINTRMRTSIDFDRM